MTVRWRLVLSFFYILLVVIIALELPLMITMRKRAQAELQTSVLAEAQLTAGYIGSENLADPPALKRIVNQAADQIGGRLVVVDMQGLVMFDSDALAPVGSDFDTPDRPEIEQALNGRPTSLVRHSDDLNTDLLAIATPIVDEVQVGALRVTLPMSQVAANLRRTTIGLVVLGAAGLAAGLVIALALAAWIARPLSRLAATARRLGEGDLSARASQIRGPREIEDVAKAFDDMADQVESKVEAEREFAHNASHQLRTPLTGMKLRLESAIGMTDDPAIRHQLEAAETEADRLATIVTRLLPGQGKAEGEEASCDLVAAVRDAVERANDRAVSAGAAISVQSPSSSWVGAAADDVAQIIDTLLDNALRYAPGRIVVAVAQDEVGAHLVVRDHGPGLSRDDRRHAWDRFTRGAHAKPGGTGLGLSIVRELAERWGGSAGFTDGTEEQEGLSITVRIPLTKP